MPPTGAQNNINGVINMRSIAIRNLLLTLLVLALLGTMTAACAEDTVDLILNTRTTQAFGDGEVAETDLNTILEAGLSAASAINQQPWVFVAITDKEMMAELSGGMGGPGGFPGPGAPGGKDGEMPEGFKPPEAPDGKPGEGAKGAMPPAGGGAKASLGDSPAAIVIYMDGNTASPNPAFDCGLACQNMVLAAKALGYGAKIVSSPTMRLNGEDHDALCEKLGVDTSCTAVAVLLIGSEAATVDGTSGASTRDTLDEKVRFIR